jgi:hypothetical protein
MIEEEDRQTGVQGEAPEPAPLVAANDNDGAEARTRIDAAMLTIARLIGRQIAREEFDKGAAQVANDNTPDSTPKS